VKTKAGFEVGLSLRQPKQPRLALTGRKTEHHTKACMKASLHSGSSRFISNYVTNTVTNPLENPGQCRAIVTNVVTKLRAIQGNEITTFGEPRAMEGMAMKSLLLGNRGLV
jgi:hypothetical protein